MLLGHPPIMTNQELFDFVVAHLRRQGVPAISGAQCRYRTRYGTHQSRSCAVGCLIKDEFYDQSLEGKSAENGRVVAAVEPSLGIELKHEHRLLLGALQGVHDRDATSIGYWLLSLESKLKDVAASYGLTYTPPVMASFL